MRWRNGKILVPMTTEDFGVWLCYKYNAKFNYYIFVSGLNVFVTFIFLILFAFVWFFCVPVKFSDTLEPLKRLYINWQFSTIVISSFLIILISIFTKTKEALRRRLLITIAIILVTIMELFIVKCNIDKTYTKEKFGELYEEEIVNKNTDTYLEFDIIGLNLKEKTQKDDYIEEMVREYKKFSIKVALGHGFLIMIAIINTYMLLKVQKKIDGMNKLKQDDVVVYDDKTEVTTGGYMTFEEYKKMKEKERKVE